MREWQSQSHVRRYCRYHIVFVPKYGKRVLFGQLRKGVGQVLRELCMQHGVELIEGHALAVILASDRDGLSFYHYDTLCSLLEMPIERYLTARNRLIDKLSLLTLHPKPIASGRRRAASGANIREPSFLNAFKWLHNRRVTSKSGGGNKKQRHPRESGVQAPLILLTFLDSRFRGNDEVDVVATTFSEATRACT